MRTSPSSVIPRAFSCALACSSLLASSAWAAAPTAGDIDAQALAAGMQAALAEAPDVAGAKMAKVLDARMLRPFIYLVRLSGNIDLQVLVVDGHVVRGRSMKAVAKYLAATHFFEHREAQSAALLAAVINQWGELPGGFSDLDAVTAGPPGTKPSLVVAGDRATLTAYDRYQEFPKPAAPGQKQVISLQPPYWLRATLRFDRRFELRWTVERTLIARPGKWTPFVAPAIAPPPPTSGTGLPDAPAPSPLLKDPTKDSAKDPARDPTRHP